MMAFATGALLKLEHLPGSVAMLLIFSLLLTLVYIPSVMTDHTIPDDQRHRRLRSVFMTVVAGALIALYFVKSIEVHDKDNVPENPWYEMSVRNAPQP
jgi:hypothetical protein